MLSGSATLLERAARSCFPLKCNPKPLHLVGIFDAGGKEMRGHKRARVGRAEATPDAAVSMMARSVGEFKRI
jgi:hypothetical protein